MGQSKEGAAKMDRAAIAAEIRRRRVSAILRTDDPEAAAPAMRAAVAGGFRVVEFTMTIPNALERIREFARDPDLLVGAGTVLEVEQARQAIAAGARFLVSPVFDRDVLAAAHALDVPLLAGAFTPNEMLAAHRAGADFVKVFPAPADLIAFLGQVRAPLPFLPLFPTAGFTVENFPEALRAGAVGLGFVKCLFEPADMRAKDWGAIEKRAAAIHARLRDL